MSAPRAIVQDVTETSLYEPPRKKGEIMGKCRKTNRSSEDTRAERVALSSYAWTRSGKGALKTVRWTSETDVSAGGFGRETKKK